MRSIVSGQQQWRRVMWAVEQQTERDMAADLWIPYILGEDLTNKQKRAMRRKLRSSDYEHVKSTVEGLRFDKEDKMARARLVHVMALSLTRSDVVEGKSMRKKYLTTAAKAGIADAIYRLAKDKKENYAKELLYKCLVKQGHAKSAYKCALMYTNRPEFKRKYMVIAASLGYHQALRYMAETYRMEREYALAADMYRTYITDSIDKIPLAARDRVQELFRMPENWFTPYGDWKPFALVHCWVHPKLHTRAFMTMLLCKRYRVPRDVAFMIVFFLITK